MIEIEQVIQWLRDGGQGEAADLLSQCAMTVEWVDILFDVAGNREFNLVDVKIEAPYRIINEIGDTLASQAEQIEKAVQDCMRTVDCVVRSIDWVPKLPGVSPKKDETQTLPDRAMRQLIDSLNELLQSSEHLNGFSQHRQSEGEEWYVADQHYVQELKTWASAVESILRLADHSEHLRAWQIVTEPKIMVANVYDYAERLRVVLRQIKSRLEQQYNYAPDLAEVSNTPFLSDSDIKLAKSIEVFFSYSHKDEELRDELEKHLSILKRQGVITGWHDRRIGAGREWAGEIDTHLNTADVVLLLISSDFLASDYCYDVEMKRAMKRHEAGEARVIPVILRPVDWKGAPFGKLQALPTDAKPVTEWPNRDGAFLNVAQGIRAAVEELVGPSKVLTLPPIQESPLAESWMPTTLEQKRRGCYAEYGRMLKFAILLLVPLVIGGILIWSDGGPLPTIIAMLSTTPRPAVKPTVAGVVGGTVVSRASDTPSPTVVPTEAPPTATATVISTPTVSATASPKPVKATSTQTPTPTRPAPTATPTQQPTARPTPIIIDTMDSISGWSKYKDDKGSSIEIESESGKTNNAVKISFSLKKDGWVGISKPLHSGLLVGTRAIRFSYKGSGAPNTIELKLIYAPNAQGKEAVFSILRNRVTDTRDWISLEVPCAEFACWWETDCDTGEPLDVSRIQRIDFAISNQPAQGDIPGTGFVFLDDVQAVK